MVHIKFCSFIFIDFDNVSLFIDFEDTFIFPDGYIFIFKYFDIFNFVDFYLFIFNDWITFLCWFNFITCFFYPSTKLISQHVFPYFNSSALILHGHLHIQQDMRLSYEKWQDNYVFIWQIPWLTVINLVWEHYYFFWGINFLLKLLTILNLTVWYHFREIVFSF